jgi:large subunit ribosomal protein L10e
MKRAYGKPTGVAARVKQNQPIFVAEVDKDFLEYAKEALKRAGDKLPVPSRIVASEL